MGYKYQLTDLQPDMTALVSLNQETTAAQNPDNTFTTGQSWGALRKAWKGYRIAKVQADDVKMREYATKIRKIQTELNVTVSSFPHLDIAQTCPHLFFLEHNILNVAFSQILRYGMTLRMSII